MERARKKGVAHQVFHDQDDVSQGHAAICSCCWDCCGVLGSYNRGATPLHYLCYTQARVAAPEACRACGLCERFCPAAAVTVREGRAAPDPKLCIGCGQCAYQCPEGVFELVPGKREVPLPVLPRKKARLGR